MDGPQNITQMMTNSRPVMLDINEWNVILAGLGELPLKVSRNVFEKVVNQLQTQERMPPVANIRPNE